MNGRCLVLALVALAGCPADDVTPSDDTQVVADTLDASETLDAPDAPPPVDSSVTDLADSSALETTQADALTDSAETTSTAPAMRLHMLDVGQGEAMIVELPCGALLVDTGGEVTDGVGDQGFDSNAALEAQVRAFFATRPDLDATFDLVVLSHPHIDHTRGVTRLLEMVAASELTIRNVLTNGDESGFDSGIDEQRALHDFADANPAVGRWYQLQRKTDATGFTNDVIDPFPACAAGGGLDPRVTALWGRIDNASPLSDTWDPNDLGNANNHSVVLRVELGASSLLLTGDLEEAGIAALITQYAGTALLDVDLYKAGHHGSYNGTTPALVNVMTPVTAVISAGPPDRVGEFTAYAFGHPRASMVSDLVGDSDSVGVSAMRPHAIDALVSTGYTDGHGVFQPRRIERAVFCTAWEGGAVVIALHADGLVVLPGD